MRNEIQSRGQRRFRKRLLAVQCSTSAPQALLRQEDSRRSTHVANAYDRSPARKDFRDGSSPYPQSGLIAADLAIDVTDLATDTAGLMVRSWPTPAACSQQHTPPQRSRMRARSREPV